MLKIENKFLRLAVVMLVGILSSCGSPPTNEKLSELQNAKKELEQNITMYDETWNIFFTGDTSIVNSDRFQEDVVVVTAQGDITGIDATRNYYYNFLTGFSNS